MKEQSDAPPRGTAEYSTGWGGKGNQSGWEAAVGNQCEQTDLL